MNEGNDWHTVTQYLYHCWRLCDEIYLNSEQGKVEFLRNYLFFPDDGLVFDGFFEDSVSAVRASIISEWHTDSKVCRIVKSGLPNKYSIF